MYHDRIHFQPDHNLPVMIPSFTSGCYSVAQNNYVVGEKVHRQSFPPGFRQHYDHRVLNRLPETEPSIQGHTHGNRMLS